MSDPRVRSQPIANFAFLFFACLLLCGIATAAPSITLSKKSGPPTSRILVSGRGFESNVGVDIFFDTKDKALVVTNGKGEFHDAGIYAPRSAHPGKHWVTALERNDDKGSQKPFLIQTDWRQFHFDAEGTRLNPFENVLNPNTVGNLQLKWTYTTGSDVFSSPAVTNGVVYVGSDDYNVYALDARTGVKLWSYATGYGWGVDSSPAVTSGVVYIGSDDQNVYALNARTGTKLWSYPTRSYVLSSPAVANGVLYVGSESPSDSVYAIDARTGTELWSFATGGYVDSSPAVVNGVVYAGSWDGNVYALDASTGTELWSYATGRYVRSSPTVANGVVYVGSSDGNLYALDSSTGSALWSYATDHEVWSSPAVSNGAVYFGSEDGNVYALNAYTGAKLWRYRTGDQLWSSPAVANGVVYVGSSSASDGRLYALNSSNGAMLWSYATGGYVESSPTVANGMVYVGSFDRNVYAFGLQHAPDGGNGSKRPGFKTLRPDFNLKVAKPDATPSSPEL
jgi:outer membrane protein assembly factor BamB